MRPRRVEHFDFVPIAGLCVIVFCFQLSTLLFVACIAFAPPSPGDPIEIDLSLQRL